MSKCLIPSLSCIELSLPSLIFGCLTKGMFLLETWGAWQDYQNPDNLGIAHSGCKFLVFNLQFSKQKTFSKSIVEIFFNSISNPSTFSKSSVKVLLLSLLMTLLWSWHHCHHLYHYHHHCYFHYLCNIIVVISTTTVYTNIP